MLLVMLRLKARSTLRVASVTIITARPYGYYKALFRVLRFRASLGPLGKASGLACLGWYRVQEFAFEGFTVNVKVWRWGLGV